MTQIRITTLGNQGDGTGADVNGKPVFVPGAVPGDLVTIDGKAQIISPGPNRAVPPCAHFGVCGGCTFQHVAPAIYEAWLTSRILSVLTPLNITPKIIMPAHVSPPHSRRRATVKYKSSDGAVTLGFNQAGAHSLVDLTMCTILTPEVWELAQKLKTYLPDYFKGPQALSISVMATTRGCDVSIAGLPPLTVGQIQKLAGLADKLNVARLGVEGPVGYETLALRHTPLTILDGVEVELAPGAFCQATVDGEAALIAAVRAGVGKARKIADLFCGIGTFAIPLASRASVLGVDAAKSAVEALARAAGVANRPIKTLHQDLFRRPMRAEELNVFDAVVFDPPRAGAEMQTIELARSKVAIVIAVSCNPNTFARDAERLINGGYVLERLWPVGQFLWSTHVELVAEFKKRR
jgi:23S rRNA (uracil1939-C5)-methyltransferase